MVIFTIQKRPIALEITCKGDGVNVKSAIIRQSLELQVRILL